MLDPVTLGIVGASVLGPVMAGSMGGGGDEGSVPELTKGQLYNLKGLNQAMETQWLNAMSPKQQQRWLKKGSTGPEGIAGYQGQRVADLDPLQQLSMLMAGSYGSLYEPAMAGALNTMTAGSQLFPEAYGQGIETLKGMLGPYDPSGATKMWETSVRDPAMMNWRNNLMPDIANQFGSTGSARSSGFARELSRAGQELNTNLAGQLSDFVYSGQQSHLSRAAQLLPQLASFSPASMASSYANLGSDVISKLMGAGAVGQENTQQQLAAAQQLWNEQQPWNNPWSQFLTQGLGTQAVSPYIQQGGAGASSMLPMLGSLLGQRLAQPQTNFQSNATNWANAWLEPGTGGIYG